jgi:pimeloyl-ACP methyl ester carboxylesterase
MGSIDRRHDEPASSRHIVGLLTILALLPMFLTGCASIVIHDRPIIDRTTIKAAPTGQPASLDDAAGLLNAGLALDKKHPDWSITYYRDAALRALPDLEGQGFSNDLDIVSAQPAQGTYRRAIEYILETAYRQSLKEHSHWTHVLARAGITVQGRLGLVDGYAWEEVLPTRRFEVKGFNRQAGQGGIGAPVVAKQTRSGDWGQSDTELSGSLAAPCVSHFPKTLYRAASAVLRPGGPADGSYAVLELHDPGNDPEMLWQPPSSSELFPLAYDMTVPLARQFHIANLNLLGALGVLYPSEYDGRTGIYMIDPYEPGKIPVVFVHGLMSSPEAWDNAMNELRGNPELRKRYQFWMFFYSTGNPILASGARFRKALNDLRAELDPDHTDQAFDKMVLVGHSMGGLLSRLAISDSGLSLWNTASKVPPDEVNLDPKMKSLLTDTLIFEPVPMVDRVVFICTPHRGSPMGDELIGRVVSRMIQVPEDVVQVRKTLMKLNGETNVAEAFRGSRYATSVAQLGISNPVLQSISKLPLSERVPYHSIVGYNGRDPLPDGGDGIVPYTSAHVEGALSEVVITSNHSAQGKEQAVTEMKRILDLHYGEYVAEQEALAAGRTPPIRITRPEGQTKVRYDLLPEDERPRENPLARLNTLSELK